ncbi:GNAT family N-acetyltransferase [Paenarthrobacter sp. OM7]|uniref:GNAT family N-acetyltransferase n=1 Tax=Paenarthrobacter sp. OM7 TaxID=3041264 RepID=UPI0024689AAD|nr:GNAT family N-acetyltransferase [Paenarthrobacter sp. OM7]WGM20513.1 GNAT family N-acetyltransferase [Paenarthrobacter sp. OM7]
MFSLTAPDVSFYESFIESHREWDGAHQDGAGLFAGDDVSTAEGFAAWVRKLADAEHAQEVNGIVPCTFRWITEDSRYVGSIAFRHYLTPSLLNSGGHIGYGVRPSDRGRGVATWALREMCSSLAAGGGPERVLLTCDDNNAASARTIERSGGVLEDVRLDGEGKAFRRYWIDLTGFELSS